LWRLNVGELEVCVRLRGLGADAMPLRFIVSNPTGLDFSVSGYYQVKDLKTQEVSYQVRSLHVLYTFAIIIYF
jgi:hypothetical protein